VECCKLPSAKAGIFGVCTAKGTRLVDNRSISVEQNQTIQILSDNLLNFI